MAGRLTLIRIKGINSSIYYISTIHTLMLIDWRQPLQTAIRHAPGARSYTKKGASSTEGHGYPTRPTLDNATTTATRSPEPEHTHPGCCRVQFPISCRPLANRDRYRSRRSHEIPLLKGKELRSSFSQWSP